LVPIALIGCVEDLTLADINEELVEEEMSTVVLGLLLNCCDCWYGA
jgi:hypothetical protein